MRENKGSQFVYSVFLLIFANALNIGGDILYAFWWNSRLILETPIISLISIGVISLIGIIGGVIIGPWVSKQNNQIKYLAVGSILRSISIIVVIIVNVIDKNWLLPTAIGIQLLDTIISTFTSGAIMTIISEKVNKDKFTQIVSINQTITQIVLIGSWFIGGFILEFFGEIGLLLVDFVTFIPLSIMFMLSLNSNRNTKFIKEKNKKVIEKGILINNKIYVYIIFFTFIMVLGSLVSRTTPILWNELFLNIKLPANIMFGVLFGVYIFGYLNATSITSTKFGSNYVKKWTINSRLILPISTLLLGISLLFLPFTYSNYIQFITFLYISGFLSGLISPIYMTKIRNSFEGYNLRKSFYYIGMVSRYSNPLANGIAGIILLYFNIYWLYYISGAGIIAISIIFILGFQTKNIKGVLSSVFGKIQK